MNEKKFLCCLFYAIENFEYDSYDSRVSVECQKAFVVCVLDKFGTLLVAFHVFYYFYMIHCV